MLKVLQSILKFILISNVFISVAAAALCMEIQYLSTGTIDLSWDYSAFIFFGTLSLYNAHRYISFNRSRLIGNTDRFKIVAELGVWVPVLVIVSVLSALLYGYPYVTDFKIPLVIATGISVLYVAPVIIGKRLRDFGWIKLPALALTFTILTAWVPAEIFELPNDLKYIICLQRFLLIFAITIPFEIRDEILDQQAGVQTIVHFLGRQNSKRVSIFLLLISMLLSTQLMDLGFYDIQTLLASITVTVLAGVLIIKIPSGEDVFYYLGGLDGILLFHFLAIIASHVELPY